MFWVPLGIRQSLDGQRVRIGSYGRAKHETSAGLPADGRQSTERHFVGAARQVQADDAVATMGGVGDDCMGTDACVGTTSVATNDACVDTDVTTTSNACVGTTSVATSDACVGEDVDGHSFIWQTIFDLPPF